METSTAVSALILKRRYRLTLYLGGGLLLLAIIGYGWASVISGQKAFYADIRAEGEQLKLSLNDTIDVAQSHVFTMRRSVEHQFSRPETSNPAMPERIRRLAVGTTPDSPWENLPLKLREEVGSLHIDPKASYTGKAEQRDIAAALSMMPAVAAVHERHKVFQWSYYYDAKMLWFMIYPVFPRAELFKMTNAQDMSTALKVLFDAENTAPVTRVGPLLNPERAQYWTAPYLDFCGKGMMVSLLAPVYLDNRYIGAVGTDVTLEMLDKVLAQHRLNMGRFLVVDGNGMLLADSGKALKGVKVPLKLNDVVPNAPLGKPATRAKNSHDSEWFKYHLKDTSWILMVHIPKSAVIGHLFNTLRPYLAMSLLLAVAIFGLSWVQNRRYIQPALQLAEYVDKVEADPETPAPVVPPIWQHWFTIVAQSAGERKKLLAEIMEHSNQLEQKVEKRTRDLSEANAALATARDAADTANQAKSTFLANMSHELRTPLNAILGFAQLMARDVALPPDTRKNLTIINRSGEHLLAMINDILDISKIEAGKIEVREEPFDLEHLVHDIGEMLRFRGYAKGLQITLELADDAQLHLSADLGKLRQVLINVMGNSLKFTEDGGITLRVRTVADQQSDERCLIEFVIQDTGPGIATEDLEAIFEPFRQIESNQNIQKGTGLGLAICRSFVRMMGGSITVESTIGKGSRFIISVPARIVTPDAIAAQEGSGKEVIGMEPDQQVEWRILIVEDAPDNIELIRKLHADIGITTRVALNGLQGLEVAREWQPHFIWMDMRMPVMDGYEATRQIRKLPGGEEIKIVALTASVFKEEESSILAAGCNAILHKPYRHQDIFSALEQQLGIRFRYKTEATVNKSGVSPPQVEELAGLSPQLIADLLQASIELDKQMILKIAADLEPTHFHIAAWLREVTDGYRFHTIEAVMKRFLSEKPSQG